MQTKQCVRLHSGTVVQMFYAIGSAIKGTLSSWGQTESSYFRHLWQAGAEPRHLAAGEPLGKAVPTAAAGPSLWTCRSLWEHKYLRHCRSLALFAVLEGESTEEKRHQGLSDTKTPAITPQAGAGTREASLYGLPSSQNPPQASTDGYCPTARGRLDRPAVWPWVHCLVSHTMIHVGEWRGAYMSPNLQSARPAWKHLCPSVLLTSCLFDSMVLPSSALQWAFPKMRVWLCTSTPSWTSQWSAESPGQHSVQMLFQS